MKFTNSRRISASIELTPLIDIMFQLLLFFILSTTFKNSPSFEVSLPEASTDQINQRDNSVTLSLTDKGDIIIDDRLVSETALLDLLAKRVVDNPAILLVIEADEATNHGIVVEMMDIAQEAGIQTLQIGAKEEQ